MNENYSKYQDFTNRLRSIQLSTRRKSLKKPNLEEILGKLKSLLRSMEESGANNEQKVMCHKEIALIYLNLGNQSESNDHWINTGRLYFDMAFDRKEINCPAENEFQLLMEQCYLNVANQFINQNNLKFASFIYSEMADKFLKLNKFNKSFDFLDKAFKLTNNDIFAKICLFDKMLDLIEISNFGEKIWNKIFNNWNLFLKSLSKDLLIYFQILALELRIILLIFISSKLTDLQQQYLSQYQNNNWKNIYLKTSWVNKQDFELICEFIKVINKEDYLKAIQIQQLNFNQLLDEKGHFLCTKLLNSKMRSLLVSINVREEEEKGINEEEEREEINEIEKRLSILQELSEKKIRTKSFSSLHKLSK
ncbi:unnamed protein product [Meloidogyne enterolobii]|uniref:Uncharacterized protein n=1 Tax=Meloidogyne enterolobii TaxID=390850 RepID=A0ACB0YP88_MELEN